MATDIAARGIHVDDVTLVVHVDPPAEHKAYLHRSGRTARAGAEGVVVTVSTPEERGDTRTLMRQAGIKPTAVDVTPGHPAIGDLTGPAAELVTPAPVVEQYNSGNGGRSQRGRGGSGAAAPAGWRRSRLRRWSWFHGRRRSWSSRWLAVLELAVVQPAVLPHRDASVGRFRLAGVARPAVGSRTGWRLAGRAPAPVAASPPSPPVAAVADRP